MPQFDRDKWNRKFSEDTTRWTTPSRVAERIGRFLPTSGRAIDIAGGIGRHSIWLAEHGLDVTLADISDVGIDMARAQANRSGVRLNTLAVDLEEEPFPAGPWDVIFSHHFLHRDLFPEFANALTAGGRLAVIQPTFRNLERHNRPPRPFLLEEGELRTLAGPLEIIHYEEGWLEEDRHEAVMVAEQRSQ